ncbi:MAG: response regulator [Alphaproteobacteria bacterium]|nr:response regulator [Alphaproteobacteria bacterium]
MKVIERDTETQLIQDLKSLWKSAPMSRCLTLRFSNLEADKEDWFKDVIDILKTHFSDDIEKLYVCHDNDIFITTRTFTEKQVYLLLTHLKHKLSPASLQGLATLFEIKVDWPKLRTMCEKKIENFKILENRRAHKKKEELKSISREDALKKLDRDLVSSLAMRRDIHESPVIMVVEDDIFTQKLVKNTLKDYENLFITGDGQGAIMTYVNKAPDVLFLDIGLPDISGLSVLEKLFKIDPDAYVVMFSGHGDKDNVMKAMEQGAKGFVGKPFTKDKLFQYIKKSPFIQAKQTQGVA